MNKKEMYDYLKKMNIWCEITEHKPVYTMSEVSEVELKYPEVDAKKSFRT